MPYFKVPYSHGEVANWEINYFGDGKIYVFEYPVEANSVRYFEFFQILSLLISA